MAHAVHRAPLVLCQLQELRESRYNNQINQDCWFWLELFVQSTTLNIKDLCDFIMCCKMEPLYPACQPSLR